MNKSISTPTFETLPEYYQGYWKYVPETDLLEALKKQTGSGISFLESIPEVNASSAYAPGKWMLKEVLGHLCDTERILVYRAMRFSRNDNTILSAFDENAFVSNSNYHERTHSDILEEWKSVRAATSTFFSGLSQEMLDRAGTANKSKVSARILLFFIIAHERHHLGVIRERYLQLT